MNNSNIQQTDIFSMFGIEDDVTRRQQKEAEERKKQQEEMQKRMEDAKKNAESSPKNVSSKTKDKAAGDEFNVGLQTFIRHLGEDIAITDYFTVEEITEGIPTKTKDGESFKKVDGEIVRKRLEKDYPDLVAAFTEMVYIKKKDMIMPIPKMRKKGLGGVKNSESLSRGSFPLMNKVPYSILSEFISISKYFSDHYGCEVHGDIYLDMDKGVFFLDIPNQYANRLWVEQTEDAHIYIALRLQNIRFKKIMEIHSHHIMEPNPSSQDNESEISHYLYAIVGRVDKLLPDITVRFYDQFNGHHIKLEPTLIFECPFNKTSFKHDLSVVEVI